MNGQYRIGDTVMQNWILVKKLGEGSFGKVYEIERQDFGETYRAALKVITVPQGSAEIQAALEEGMSPGQAERYFYSCVEDIVKEFALMARVKGTAHVVGYEDHQVLRHEQGIGWDILIRMEELTPLLAYAYAHPFTRRDVIRLGIHLCKSLELCQKYNIIHRDLKPENIFVSENGDFKLGDFGIARTVEKTMSGLSKKGTYNYMAPEVYKGTEYGFSVDIYSLGIVLYRLLNKNRVPFLPPAPTPLTYNSREQALARRMSGEPLPLPCYGSGRLGEIVLKAAAYDPKDRYSSPGQMRAELEAILYDAEDASVIYPEGDEISLKENIYATMKRGERKQEDLDEASGATVSGFSGSIEAAKALAETKRREAAHREEDPKASQGRRQAEEYGLEDEGEKTVSVFGETGENADSSAPGPEGSLRQDQKSRKKKGMFLGIGAGMVALAAVAGMVAVLFLRLGNVPGQTGDFSQEGGIQAEDAVGNPSEPSVEERMEEYNRLRTEAESLYDSSPAEAMGKMEEALALFPEEDAARTDYAYALYRSGDYEGCIQYGEKDLALGKGFEAEYQSRLNEILGAAYYEKADYAGAAAYFRLSAAGEEMSESAMRDYAVCLARLGSAGEAKDVLAALRRQGANSDVTLYVEGEVAYAAGEYGEAEKIFLEGLASDADIAMKQRAFRSLARLYRDCAGLERIGESPLAGSTVDTPAVLKETKLLYTGIQEYGLQYDSSLYEMLGQAAYDAHSVAAAGGLEPELGQDYRLISIEAFEQVLALGMEKDYIYSNLYSIQYDMGAYGAAGDVLDRMEAAFPRSYVPHALRGILYITLENQKEESGRDYQGAESEYRNAKELVGSGEDATYLQQLEGLMDQLRKGGWLK